MNTSLKITEKAENGTFEKCKVYGGVENAGQNMKFKETSIGLKNFTNNHPILYGTISAIIGGVATLIIEYFLFK